MVAAEIRFQAKLTAIGIVRHPSTRNGKSESGVASCRGLEELTYPFHGATFTVPHCGRICFEARKMNLSQRCAARTSA
jgi:hypothetical protein